MLYKLRYILWAKALLGAIDVVQYGGHCGRHLGFYQKLETMKKRLELKILVLVT